MKISIIMLTYNRETLVSRAIMCILGQTFKDFEFIVINNGSTDRSGLVADEYAKKDGRIRVMHRGRGNIGSGRNAGLNAARGEYIVFIDDDDWCEADFLEFLYNLALENDAEVSICGSTSLAFDEKLIMSAEEALMELMRRKRYNTAFPGKLFKRELAENLRFPESGAFDDIALLYRLLARPKRVAYHGLPKYTFYRHEGNNSAWTTNFALLTPGILNEYLGAYRERAAWLTGVFPDCAAAWRYFEWSFMISMIEKVTRLGIAGCGPQLEEMKLELRTHYEEFVNSEFTLEFEKEWMKIYV